MVCWPPLECLAARGSRWLPCMSWEPRPRGAWVWESRVLPVPSILCDLTVPSITAVNPHMSLIFPLPSLIPTPPPHPAARTMGFITIGPNFIFFLAPWLLAHSRCTLKMFWCVNEWVGNAVQASHQADTLYLQALHFARVPLRNLTRLERVEEKGGHSGAAHSCQHIFNAYNLKEHGLCILGSYVFLFPQFLVPIV